MGAVDYDNHQAFNLNHNALCISLRIFCHILFLPPGPSFHIVCLSFLRRGAEHWKHKKVRGDPKQRMLRSSAERRRYAWQETLYMITSSSLFSSISCKVALLFLIFPSLHAVSPFLFSPSLVYIQGSHLLNWKKSMIFYVFSQIYSDGNWKQDAST